MRKILLVCSAGMSTSLLVNKMLEEGKREGYDLIVEAHSISEIRTIGKEWDVILLGPQVKFQLNEMKKSFPHLPVEAMDMKSYGRMDAKAILNQAKKLLGDCEK